MQREENYLGQVKVRLHFAKLSIFLVRLINSLHCEYLVEIYQESFMLFNKGKHGLSFFKIVYFLLNLLVNLLVLITKI